MKILFVKLGAIGDVVQAVVAIRAYKDENPHVVIEWVIGKSLSNFVQALGVADRIWEVDEKRLFVGSFWSRSFYLMRLMIRLGFNRIAFDKIITAYRDQRYRLLTFFTRGYCHNAFYNPRFSKNSFSCRNRVFEYWKLLNGQDGYVALNVDRLTQRLGRSLLSRPLSDEAASALTTLPENYIVIVPGGARNLLRSDNLRRWPVANYRDLAERLIVRGYQVVLLGGSEDVYVCEVFSELNCVDWLGRTDLIGSVHVLNRARAVVTHDTGPMHLASMTSVPLVALFGPTLANACVSLDRPQTEILQVGNIVACSPCYDGKDYAPCNTPYCMKAITVDHVEISLNHLLSKNMQDGECGDKTA